MSTLPSIPNVRPPLVGGLFQTKDLIPDLRNARKHSRSQIERLKAAILEFEFVNPILIDENFKVIAGHARLQAAIELRLVEVACIQISHLAAAQKRALAIADNRIAELASWDAELLRQELEALVEVDFEIETTGFSTAEIDVIFDVPVVAPDQSDPDDELPIPEPDAPPVTQPGELWRLDKHYLLCGSSLEAASYQQVLGGEQAQLIVSDAPYNVPIAGHVSGLGRVRHGDFAMASGEMSKADFTAFLTTAFKLAAEHSMEGSIHFQFMDFRHLGEMLAAGEAAYTELKNLCVWTKTNGGMGSLYRAQHELVFVWKSGRAPHINNVELGKHGRYRTNVWQYAGANTFKSGRDDELAMHPTVKPVALVADAIRDCSKVAGLVLDPFGGSGTTIIAAERTRRRAALIEIEPRYVDTAIRRWQKLTGKSATLAKTSQTFADVEALRAADAVSADGAGGPVRD
ncbi:MAG: DNA methyltransferase [Dehalococcoidia bacterium]